MKKEKLIIMLAFPVLEFHNQKHLASYISFS